MTSQITFFLFFCNFAQFYELYDVLVTMAQTFGNEIILLSIRFKDAL